jgi:leucyl aminopeptidase (aminopeptidase T)
MADLQQAVAAVVNDCLAVREGEAVVVVCNPATLGLGERMRGEAGRAGADAMLAMMAERPTHGSEPPEAIAAAMAAADAVLCPTEQSLSHTAARRHANEAGARIATLPGVTEDMLARVMSADMAELRRRGEAVARILSDASEAHITCVNGSDLHLDLTGRDGIPDYGDITERGAFGNLPCGEGYVAPLNGSGRLIVSSLAGIGLGHGDLTVEDGRLTRATGDEGEQLLATLLKAGELGTNLAELGVGTNEKATLTGIVLEDEKMLGTVHVAFGASMAIGGTVSVPVHLDSVIVEPTLHIGSTAVIEGGRFLL